MVSVVQSLYAKKLITPPKWLESNIHLETEMGSVAYGVSGGNSDIDIYGFVIPPLDDLFPHMRGEIPGFGTQYNRFEQYQEHHVKDGNLEYDLSIYSITKYFQLCMGNNPNMVDSLFTPINCVRHITKIGQMVRDQRKIFLHKGSYHKFRGYLYSQLNKMHNGRQGKRQEMVKEYGFDCYDDAETEFLTNSGWKKFDDIGDDDLVAACDVLTNTLCFEKPLGRVDKLYDGILYTIEPYMTRCVVTENHNMLVSQASRRPANNYSRKYDHSRAKWELKPLSDLRAGDRSSFHIRLSPSPRIDEYAVSDEYLKLAGLYVSEGSAEKKRGVITGARFTQTRKGKVGVYEMADSISGLRKHDYDRETVWRVDKERSERLNSDFGHGSYHLRLPCWCYQLSYRQAGLLWHSLFLGDGTVAPNGQVYYTCNRGLAGDIQAMMVSAGYVCSVRGPYGNGTQYGKTEMYQVYLPSDKDIHRCVDFKAESKCRFEHTISEKEAVPVKMRYVTNQRVVCFTMPSGTLVTRSNGKQAIQGNCKFASHAVRLGLECEQILETGDLNLQRDKELIKAIRNGEWTEDRIRDWVASKEKHWEELYATTKLPNRPDKAKIKQLLVDCLEEHYGRIRVSDAFGSALVQTETSGLILAD